MGSIPVEAVLFFYLLWCGWVLLGWTVTRGRRLLRTLHIASILYAIAIELALWPPCPLTAAEVWLEARAGREPTQAPFLVRMFDAIVYPDLPEWLVVGCAVVVCGGILCVYLRRYRGFLRGAWTRSPLRKAGATKARKPAELGAGTGVPCPYREREKRVPRLRSG